jgi:hypothetical protein
LSNDKHGCRVVQAGFEKFTFDQKHQMLSELSDNVIDLAKDFNGNHVIQKILINMG